MRQAFSLPEIVTDHRLPFPSFFLRNLRESVTGKIYQPPFGNDPAGTDAFHGKMIDKLGLAGRRRCFCETMNIRQHIDKGRLTYIAAANKCKFRQIRDGAVLEGGAADHIFGRPDFHTTRY